MRLAPTGWKTEHLQAPESVQPYYEESTVSDKESRSTWAKLIAQVYEVDPLVCPRCSAPMRILAIITEPEEVRKILRHLVKIGRSPPGLDLASLNYPSVHSLLVPGAHSVPVACPTLNCLASDGIGIFPCLC